MLSFAKGCMLSMFFSKVHATTRSTLASASRVLVCVCVCVWLLLHLYVLLSSVGSVVTMFPPMALPLLVAVSGTQLELHGIKFGAHQNAYTSFEETVYELHVPADSSGLLQRSLRVLRQLALEVGT